MLLRDTSASHSLPLLSIGQDEDIGHHRSDCISCQGSGACRVSCEFDLNSVVERVNYQVVCVHGRTRDQTGTASGVANWDAIRAVRYVCLAIYDGPSIETTRSQAVSIPVIANGGVVTHQDFIDCLKHTDAHAVMVGEALMANPCFFMNEHPPVWQV